MLSLGLGVVVIILGGKAFTPQGLPLTRSKNLTGAGAKVLGVGLILMGLALCLEGFWVMVLQQMRR